MAAARIRWDRVGRCALLCVFALILGLYVGPARTWLETYGEAERQRAEVAELRAEHARLQAAKRDLAGRRRAGARGARARHGQGRGARLRDRGPAPLTLLP